jgi:3-hydroxy-3-methylglutaryl CoA synthase
MVGIVGYGGYVPRLRLNRMAIMKSMGWFAPALFASAQGERSMANWDEDCMTMAVAASRDCLPGVDKSRIDAVYMASTTMPFLDRDNAGVLKATLNLRDDITSADFSSSLKAGTTALVTALDAVKGGDKRQVLVAASDNRRSKAASLQEMWFGDGAGALVVGNENVIAEYLGSYSVSHDFVDHYHGTDVKYDYTWEDRFSRDEGYAKIYPQAFKGLMEKTGVAVTDITKIIYPCVYGRIHQGLAVRAIGASPDQVAGNMHEETGECGTGHPFLMLAKELEQAKPGDKFIVAGYGQGADALMFQVTDNIKNFAPHVGVSGYLAKKKVEETYTKWLQFNDLIETDLGGRGDQDFRTGLSALWRHRKLIFGFVGGKCSACGTPQIPAARVCVKPDCGAIDTLEEYEFADQPAKILTYTADNLAASLDPPAIYGLVQFDNGGRMMMDFTDCVLDDVEVGVPMETTFRKKYHDPKRGFTGYFWKAVPKIA